MREGVILKARLLHRAVFTKDRAGRIDQGLYGFTSLERSSSCCATCFQNHRDKALTTRKARKPICLSHAIARSLTWLLNDTRKC